MAAHDYLILDDDTMEAARGGDAPAREAFFRQFERPSEFPGAAAVRRPE